MTSYDVVIIGTGNAALTSALAARENGAAVLILEKAPEHEKAVTPISPPEAFVSAMII